MPEFFLYDEVAHHQVCNFIKKRLHRRCSTVNFAKFLRAPSRTPAVNASAFDATFLTLRPRMTYIYGFPANSAAQQTIAAKPCCEVFQKEIRKTCIVNCNFGKALSFRPKDYYPAIKEMFAILVLPS